MKIRGMNDLDILAGLYEHLDLSLIPFSLNEINGQVVLQLIDKRFFPKGLRAHCVVGDSLQCILSESSYENLMFAAKSNRPCSLTLETKIGIFSFHLICIENADNIYLLTQIKQREETIEESTMEVKKLLHDIKQPLSNIAGFAECLEDELKTNNAVNGMERECAQRISNNARRLAGFIDSYLENEGPPDTDLNVLMHELLDDFKMDLTKKHIGVSFEVLPRLKMTYPDVRRLFSNLISNAIKYSKEHSGNIKIYTEQYEDEFCTVHIRDHGTGIPADLNGLLFRPFTRFHTECKGVGLGLNICREIVEKYGGEIQSEPCKDGSGTVFSMRLPFNKECSRLREVVGA
ncbi:MAG: HAMP domain-containing histidine kinase [Planctomycetes bacterium]|nr:HAMP domain-containing histidine kinase [Planctomycetota bacterium]